MSTDARKFDKSHFLIKCRAPSCTMKTNEYLIIKQDLCKPDNKKILNTPSDVSGTEQGLQILQIKVPRIEIKENKYFTFIFGLQTSLVLHRKGDVGCEPKKKKSQSDE